MAFSLVACTSTSVPKESAKDAPKESSQSAPQQSSQSAPKVPAQKVTLKVANNQPDSHPWNVAIKELASLVANYSNGGIEIVNYPNATLGNEPELLESVKQGSLDMAIVDPTVGTTFCKELELFSLPFIFRDYDHWQKVFNGEIGKQYASLIEGKTGVKILGVWGGSTRNLIATKKQVKSIDDLQGFKLRLAPSDLKFKVWKAVGTLPVAIAFGETYSALSSGLCDGMENEMPSILASKFYEPAPYFTLTQHEITVRPMFMNAKKFNSLNPEMQQALTKAMDEITVKARAIEKEVGAKAEKEMVEKYGIKIVNIDKAPIIAKTSPIFKEFGESTGTTKIIDAIVNLK